MSLHEIENKILESKNLRTLDKLPNFLVFVIFWIIIFFTGIFIKETIG